MTAPRLALTGVRKHFVAPDGEVQVILDVPEFRIHAGEQVGLHGPSGSGKTTLLHVIAGLLRADAGHVEVAGHALEALPESGRDRVRARHVGYVFQTFNLLPGLSALENVAIAMHFAGDVDLDRAHALLARVGLADRAEYRPRQLSVGQRQRVAVARALANQPALVLADEPTGNLDARRGAETLAMIREICSERGAALLLVSHAPEVLAQFSRTHSLRELNRAPAIDPECRP